MLLISRATIISSARTRTSFLSMLRRSSSAMPIVSDPLTLCDGLCSSRLSCRPFSLCVLAPVLSNWFFSMHDSHPS